MEGDKNSNDKENNNGDLQNEIMSLDSNKGQYK